MRICHAQFFFLKFFILNTKYFNTHGEKIECLKEINSGVYLKESDFAIILIWQIVNSKEKNGRSM